MFPVLLECFDNGQLPVGAERNDNVNVPACNSPL